MKTIQAVTYPVHFQEESYKELSNLIEEKNYPKSLINVEKELKVNGLKKRYDIVVYNPDGSILIMVECKADKIKINQTTFDQIARYNLALNAEYLMVTNGLNHYYCQMDFKNECYNFLQDIPEYNNQSQISEKTQY